MLCAGPQAVKHSQGDRGRENRRLGTSSNRSVRALSVQIIVAIADKEMPCCVRCPAGGKAQPGGGSGGSGGGGGCGGGDGGGGGRGGGEGGGRWRCSAAPGISAGTIC